MARIEETKVLTAHIPLPLASRGDEYAEKLERSRGWIVRQALSDWISQEEEREQLTHAALSSVATGHTVPHDAVTAWAAQLK